MVYAAGRAVIVAVFKNRTVRQRTQEFLVALRCVLDHRIGVERAWPCPYDGIVVCVVVVSRRVGRWQLQSMDMLV